MQIWGEWVDLYNCGCGAADGVCAREVTVRDVLA